MNPHRKRRSGRARESGQVRYYRGTLLMRKRPSLEHPYAYGPMMVLGGLHFLMSEVPLVPPARRDRSALGSQAPPFTSRGMLPESLSARQHSVMKIAAAVISTRPVFELKYQEFPECTTITTQVLSDTSHSSSCVVNSVVCVKINLFEYLAGLDQTQHWWGCIHGAGSRVGSDEGLSVPFSVSLCLSPSLSLSLSLSLPVPLPLHFFLGGAPSRREGRCETERETAIPERQTDYLRCERVRTASLAACGSFWCRV